MKISVAQCRAVPGDIQHNVAHHKTLIDIAVSLGADTIVFPELSTTGYEPALANAVATNEADRRFEDFQRIADKEQVTIGIGVPIRFGDGVTISTVVFRPHQSRTVYSKQYIHRDEERFFVRGPVSDGLIGESSNVALAICYELSVPEHAEAASRNGAEIYIASVAKLASQVDGAAAHLSEIANQYSMTAIMSNCVGPLDGGEGGGRSSVWNSSGMLLGQLDATCEGILMLDTETQDVVKRLV